jgi:phage-related holin
MKFNETMGESLLFFKGALLFLIGPLNAQLSYVALAIFIDLMFGMRVAKKERTFSWSMFGSKVGNKLLVYGAWVSMFNALDMVAGLPNTARNAVILVLISMEIFSASKNTAKLGYGKLASLMENIYFLITKDNPVAPKEEEKQEGSDKQ